MATSCLNSTDNNITQCFSHGVCGSNGKCVCDLRYNTLSFCATQIIEDAGPGVILLYSILLLVLGTILIFGCLIELIFDFHHHGAKLFRNTSSIVKIFLLLYGIAKLISALIYLSEVILNSVKYASVEYSIHLTAIAILVFVVELASVQWFELVLKAKNLGTNKKSVRIIRLIILITISITLPPILICVILEKLNIINISIGPYASVVVFVATLMVSTFYVIKGLHWLNKLRGDSFSPKLKILHRKTVVLITLNIVVIANYLGAVFNFYPNDPIKTFIYTSFFSFAIEFLVSVMLWYFIQNYAFRNSSNIITNYQSAWSGITQESTGSGFPSGDKKETSATHSDSQPQ